MPRDIWFTRDCCRRDFGSRNKRDRSIRDKSMSRTACGVLDLK